MNSSYAVYDITLAGYDGSTDKTDHLVRWVAAPNREAVDQYLARIGSPELHGHPYEIYPHGDGIGRADGVDVFVDNEGNEIP